MSLVKMILGIGILPLSIFALDYDSFIGKRDVGSKTYAYHLKIEKAECKSSANTIVNDSDITIHLSDKYLNFIILSPKDTVLGDKIMTSFKLNSYNECIYFSYIENGKIEPFKGRCLTLRNLQAGDKFTIFNFVLD